MPNRRKFINAMAGRLCALTCGLLASRSISYADGPPELARRDVFVNGAGGYHTYRIPALVVTNRGTVLAFCEGRKTSSEDTGDIDLLLKRSEDGGRSWPDQITVHEDGGDAPVTIGNPVPIIERGRNRIHLLFVRNYKRLFHTQSTDDGRTWSEPREETGVLRELDYPRVLIATGPVHGIQMSTGRLVAPIWICDRERSDRYENVTHDRMRAGVLYSGDGGATWKTGGLVPTSVGMLHEGTVAELTDGSLMLNMRATGKGYRAVSVSADGGLSWSNPILDKSLPDPTCQGSMLRAAAGQLLFANLATSNNLGSRGRRNLTLRMSGDDGANWRKSIVLNPGPAGYSDLAQTPDGTILCLFENGKEVYREKISLIELPAGWLRGE